MATFLSLALRRVVLLVAGFLAFGSVSPAHAESLLKAKDHLAFIGEQLTSEPGYAAFIEDYVIACAQVPDVEIEQFGWCAATADAFVPQMDACLKPFKPTVATIYFPSDGKDGDARRTAETSLIEALKKAGVRTIVLGSPKCVDSYLAVNRDPAKGEALNQQLKAIAEGDKELAGKEGVVYADVFGVTYEAMKAAKAKFGPLFAFDQSSAFRNRNFTIAMAYAFLKALGFDGDLGSISVDYATHATSTTGGHKVNMFNGQLLVGQSTAYSFCYPCFPTGGTSASDLFGCLPFNNDLNKFRLIVKNLPSKEGAKIIWNAPYYNGQRWKDFTADELAQGVILPEVAESPFGSRFTEIHALVGDQFEAQQAAGLALLAGKPDPEAEARAKAALANARFFITAIPYKIYIQPLVAPVPPEPAGVPVIVDTDMSSDIDDGGALALVNSFSVQGEAKLIACAVDMVDRDQSSGAVCKAINTWYGNGAVPIGAYHGTRGKQLSGSAYTLAVHKHFCPDFPNDDKLPDGVDVYRKALAEAPDDSVVIVSLGLLTNIQDLEESKPDAVSPLSGMDLIKKKVKKIVIMANTLKTDQPILDAWPKPIVWTTFIGSSFGIGKGLIPTPEENPVRFAYAHNGPSVDKSSLMNGRQAWDPTAAWLGVRGAGDLWDTLGYGTYRIDAAGNPDWRPSDSTKETLISFRMPPQQVAAIMDAELGRAPTPKK